MNRQTAMFFKQEFISWNVQATISLFAHKSIAKLGDVQSLPYTFNFAADIKE